MAKLIRDVTIRNQRGLHARASAQLVKLCQGFACEIEVCKDGQAVSASSIMGLMMLAAGPGSLVTITAEGPDAEKAVDAICALIDDFFGEGG